MGRDPPPAITLVIITANSLGKRTRLEATEKRGNMVEFLRSYREICRGVYRMAPPLPYDRPPRPSFDDLPIGMRK